MVSATQLSIRGPSLAPSCSSPNLRTSRGECVARNLPFRPLCPVGIRLSTGRLCVSHRRPTFLCALGGNEEQGNDGESLWKNLEQRVSDLKKEQSIQDVLRDQIRKSDYADGGGGSDGGMKGRGGGGGGGGGSGDPEDEGSSGLVDEIVQVVLATLGFIAVYAYIIRGEEILRLAKDLWIYVFQKKKSLRLERTIYAWKRFFTMLSGKKRVRKTIIQDQAIRTTPTWYYSPKGYSNVEGEINNLEEQN